MMCVKQRWVTLGEVDNGKDKSWDGARSAVFLAEVGPSRWEAGDLEEVSKTPRGNKPFYQKGVATINTSPLMT